MWMHLLLLSALSGTVLDEKGSPVEGAVVVLIPASFRDEPVTGTSDAMGRFEVALEKPGTFRVEAHAQGYTPFRARDVDPAKPLAIVLRRGGEAIAGVVRDGQTLEAIPDAVVETHTREAGARVATAPRLGIVEAVTDERGEFRLEGLEKSSYSVSASAPGYGRTTSHDVSPGETVELYLFSGSGVYGRLLDEKGNPVEGALVSVENEDRMRRGGLPPAQRSDAEGRFALLGLEAGRYRLFARHDDLAPAVHDVELARESDTEVEIVLTKGVTLTGRLIDERGDPVIGRVSLAALDGGPVGALLRSCFTAETDAEGNFSLASIPVGAHTLTAEARGYGSGTVEAVVSGRAKEADLGDILLEIGLSVSGRVVDEGGNPVPSANVYAYPSQERVAISATEKLFETETDAAGRFVVAGLTEGVYNLNAGAPGFGFSKPQVARTGASNVVIALKGAGSIRGTVVDPEGRPVTRLRAVARSPEPRASGTLSQGDDGVFLIENVSEGEYAVEILAPEFLPEAISSVRVSAGNVSDLGTIRLRRGGQVEGTVVNGSDEAVPGATVRAILPGRRMYDSVDRDVATDRSGRFRISGIPDGEVDVVATHPLYAETHAEEVEIDSASGPAEVKIVLRRGGSLEGYVRSRDGSEISGRTIQVMSHEARLDPFGEGLTRTSDDGFFRFEKLPPGTLTVALVQVEPTSMYAIQSREVEIREEETTYIEFLSRRVLVQGQVRRGGAPLAGVALELNSTGSGMRATFGFSDQGVPASSGPWYLTAVTTEDGYYELLVGEPGEYRISAAANGVALPPRTVTIPDADSFPLDLDFGGTLVSGRVVDKETEAPIGGAFVTAGPTWPRTNTAAAELQVGPDGLFELELEPGEFHLVVRAEGYGTAEERIAVSEGGRSDVVIALSAGLHIAGRVVDGNGRWAGNVRVISVEDTPDFLVPPARMGFAMSLPDGTFRLDDLARGHYNVLATSADGFGFLPSVAPGTGDLVLSLRPGGKVEALVVDQEGTPVENAIVAVAAIEGRKVRGVQGSTDSAGRLELDVPQGNVTIKAALLNGPDGMSTVAVSRNVTARVEIVLAQTASSRSRK